MIVIWWVLRDLACLIERLLQVVVGVITQHEPVIGWVVLLVDYPVIVLRVQIVRRHWRLGSCCLARWLCQVSRLMALRQLISTGMTVAVANIFVQLRAVRILVLLAWWGYGLGDVAWGHRPLRMLTRVVLGRLVELLLMHLVPPWALLMLLLCFMAVLMTTKWLLDFLLGLCEVI